MNQNNATLQDRQSDRTAWRIGFMILAGASLAAFLNGISIVHTLPVYAHSVKLWAAILAWLGLLGGLASLTWFPLQGRWNTWLGSLQAFSSKYRAAAWLLVAFAYAGFFYLVFVNREYTPLIAGLWIRIFLLTGATFFSGWGLQVATGQPIWKSYALAGMTIGVIWQILTYLPFSANDPFSFNWGEASWYYYASFFFSKRIYGTAMAWPFLDIGRPILLSPVFLLPHPPIWLIRFWQMFLWLGTSALVAWLLYRRIRFNKNRSRLFLVWAFLWLLTGPVYYHLNLAVALVLWGFDRNRPIRSCVAIGLASIWTGILRINWVPLPAMLAIALHLLEQPFVKPLGLWDYLKKPFLYSVVGLLAGSAAFLGYLALSGRADTRIGTKFTAPFLLYRLWPNATLSTGILPGVLLVSAFVGVTIYAAWRAHRYHLLRFGLLLAMLAILLAGGLVASIRIGGGNNLHNLDDYLVLLLIWGFYSTSAEIRLETTGSNSPIAWPILTAVCLTPVIWGMLFIPSLATVDTNRAEAELTQLNQAVQRANAQAQPVLFIYQRQLITFGYVKTPLVQEYQLEEITEMANDHNLVYLDQFERDLAAHKYGLIVMDGSRVSTQTRDHAFSDENNAWSDLVLKPLTQKYHLLATLPLSGTCLYVPNP